MKLSTVVALFVLVLPLMGADDEGCGPGAVTPGPLPVVEPKCTARSCEDGCCLKDVCYRSQTLEVCGSFGTTCVMCQSLQTCQQQGASQGWECVADLTSKWSVQPQGANIPLLDPVDGEEWDADYSAPDVVVEMDCPIAGVAVPTSTSESSSYHPSWTDGACVTSAQELLKEPVKIRVIDVDAVFDDEISARLYEFTDADFKKGSVEVPTSSDGVHTLKLRLSRVQ